MFDKVVFAGGGHRCWWQAGFWDRVSGEIELHPRVIAGVSFGAVIACLLHAGDSKRALSWYERELKSVRSNFNWLNLVRRDRRLMPNAAIQRKALRALLGGDSFRQLMWRAPEIRVQYARLPEGANASRTVLGALLARRLDGPAGRPIRGATPGATPAGANRRLGLTIEAKRIQDCRSERELVDLLAAATCAPPFTAVEALDGVPCVDAGLLDEAQLGAVADVPGQTLVLGTRRDPSRAPVYARDGFVHVQPSAKIAVGRWDYTSSARFQKAYDLGLRDGEAFLRTFALGQYWDPSALRLTAPAVAETEADGPAGDVSAKPDGVAADRDEASAENLLDRQALGDGSAGGGAAVAAQASKASKNEDAVGAVGAAAAAGATPAPLPVPEGASPAPAARQAIAADAAVPDRDVPRARDAATRPDAAATDKAARRRDAAPRSAVPRAAPVPLQARAHPDDASEGDLFPPMHAVDDDERDGGGALDVSAKLAAYRETADHRKPGDYKDPTEAGMADDLRASQPAASDGQARSGRSLRASNT